MANAESEIVDNLRLIECKMLPDMLEAFFYLEILGCLIADLVPCIHPVCYFLFVNSR